MCLVDDMVFYYPVAAAAAAVCDGEADRELVMGREEIHFSRRPPMADHGRSEDREGEGESVVKSSSEQLSAWARTGWQIGRNSWVAGVPFSSNWHRPIGSVGGSWCFISFVM